MGYQKNRYINTHVHKSKSKLLLIFLYNLTQFQGKKGFVGLVSIHDQLPKNLAFFFFFKSDFVVLALSNL